MSKILKVLNLEANSKCMWKPNLIILESTLCKRSPKRSLTCSFFDMNII